MQDWRSDISWLVLLLAWAVSTSSEITGAWWISDALAFVSIVLRLSILFRREARGGP